MLADEGFVGGVGGEDRGEERRHGGGVEAQGDGLELGGGEGVGVAVGELGEAREYLLLYALRGRHCGFDDAGVDGCDGGGV